MSAVFRAIIQYKEVIIPTLAAAFGSIVGARLTYFIPPKSDPERNAAQKKQLDSNTSSIVDAIERLSNTSSIAIERLGTKFEKSHERLQSVGPQEAD